MTRLTQDEDDDEKWLSTSGEKLDHRVVVTTHASLIAAFARFDDTARDFHDMTVRPRRFIARGHLQPSQDDKRPGSQSQGDRATTSLG